MTLPRIPTLGQVTEFLLRFWGPQTQSSDFLIYIANEACSCELFGEVARAFETAGLRFALALYHDFVCACERAQFRALDLIATGHVSFEIFFYGFNCRHRGPERDIYPV